MSSDTVFKDNGNQVVRRPVEARFPEDVKKVHVRVIGQERILSPAATGWDSFFLGEESVSDDFMVERASQEQAPRKAPDD